MESNHIYRMKGFPLAFSLALITIFHSISDPATADLDPAETVIKSSVFNTWCGNRVNDFEVSIEGDRLLMNGKDGIDKS